MVDDHTRLRGGIALVALGTVLLFGPVALGLPFAGTAGAVAVLGLAAGAVLVGTAGDGRPV
ncbi:hypothetical protein [Halorussus caseinilyticus]|uniref:Transporter n=1 Tax=Halorussus caseinilyticus TaxID=3034025 RepID=A0ABD5WQP2_9EURY|nr:hypothetical protein [Halorussus sp. DT72]